MQSLPTEKITKKPIPDEHLILKTTFEDLIQRCLSSATDPVCVFYFVQLKDSIMELFYIYCLKSYKMYFESFYKSSKASIYVWFALHIKAYSVAFYI